MMAPFNGLNRQHLQPSIIEAIHCAQQLQHQQQQYGSFDGNAHRQMTGTLVSHLQGQHMRQQEAGKQEMLRL
jgi:hypothetical protein